MKILNQRGIFAIFAYVIIFGAFLSILGNYYENTVNYQNIEQQFIEHNLFETKQAIFTNNIDFIIKNTINTRLYKLPYDFRKDNFLTDIANNLYLYGINKNDITIIFSAAGKDYDSFQVILSKLIDNIIYIGNQKYVLTIPKGYVFRGRL
jgi:hypothetical protein